MDIRSWKVIEYTRTCSLPSPLPPISLPPSLSPSLPTSLTLYISLSPPSSLAFSLDLPFVSSPSPLLHPALTLPPPSRCRALLGEPDASSQQGPVLPGAVPFQSLLSNYSIVLPIFYSRGLSAQRTLCPALFSFPLQFCKCLRFG